MRVSLFTAKDEQEDKNKRGGNIKEKEHKEMKLG
jgi:hypothetical protein